VNQGTTKGSVSITATGNSSISAIYGLYSAQAEGSVDVELDSVTASVLYGEAAGSDTGKDITVDIKNTSVTGAIYGAGDYSSNCHVGGNLTLSMDSASSCYSVYGAYYTTVGGNVIVNADNNKSSSTQLCAFYSASSNYTCSVGGNVEVNVTGGNYGQVYGVDGYQYTNNSGSTSYTITVKGNVKLTMSDAYVSGNVYAAFGTAVEGDVVLLSEENSNTQCTYYVYGSCNSLIGGNLKADFYNYNTNSGAYFYGNYSSSVGKNVDINVVGGTYSSVYGAYGSTNYSNGNYVPAYSIGGDFNFNCSNTTCTSSMWPIYGNDIGGNATVTVATINNPNKYSLYYYGIYNSIIHGKADTTVSGIEYSSSINGIQASQILNETEAGKTAGEDGYINHINISDVTCSSSIYGVSESSGYNIKGDTFIDINSCTAYNVYGYEGSTYSSSEPDDININVNIERCIATNSLYGIQGGKFKGNVKVNSSYNIAQYKYMTSYVYSYKSLVINSSYENDAAIKDEAGNSLMDNYTYTYGATYYVTSSGHLEGTVDVNLSNINTSYFYGLNNVEMGASANMTIKDSSFSRASTDNSTSTLYTSLYYPNVAVSDKTVTANISLENVDFSGYTNGKITNRPVSNSDVAITFDDKCTFADDIVIIPSESEAGKLIITKGNDIYLGGDFTLDKDITAENIYVGNYNEYASGNYTYTNYGPAFITIPKDVTLKATGNIYLPVCSSILNKGTISGTIASTVETSTYNNGAIYGKVYVNGGSMSEQTNSINLYYPIYVDYAEKGGTVTKSGIYSISQDTDNVYSLAGSAVSFVLTPKKGYYVAGAKVKHGADAQEESIPVDSTTSTTTTYTFDMTENYTYVNLLFAGKQIVLGKTVADPVAILNQTTTAEEPLYDMADVTITNDGKEGTVTYEVDKTYGLPQGLEFADGKIYGTPTVAYEEGKKTVIHVTGRNDTKADLTLNIIVSADKVEQTNQEGRITIDEEAKTITLNGCSVVMEESEDGTAIYIDDNKDGIADKTTPLYSGDLSSYTITGISDTEVTKSFKITMNGGNVGTIYGAYASEMSVAVGDAIDIEILGGTVGTCYALSGSTVEGTIREVLKSDNVKTKGVGTGTYSYTGAYYQYQNSGDILYIYKTYTVDNDIDVKTLTLYDNSSANETVTFNGSVGVSGTLTVGKYTTAILNAQTTCDTLTLSSSGYATLTIEKTAQLTVNSTSINSSSDAVNHKGTFECTGTFKNSGKWYVMGGTFTEATNTASYSNLYYPVSVSTDMTKATLSFNTDYGYVQKKDTDYYGCKDKTINITYKSIAGYDVYITVNDGEPELVTGTYASFTMPACVTAVAIDYVPKQISLSRTYADPVAKAGEEYTADSPLYDLTTLVINDDTTSDYGSSVTYTVKKGSSLPAGLSLEGGKIVGTVTAVDVDGTTTTFVIKGRNDTTAEFDMHIVVQDTDYQDRDLTDEVSVASKTIDLKGNSVVILTSTSDSSKVSIYPDANHDGIADSSKALSINGETSYDLTNYTIYGYTVDKNSETGEINTYEGDISIYVKGGTINRIYGVYGTSADNKAVVDGKVTINISGGTIKSYTEAAVYADVTESELILTGGTVSGSVYAADNSTVKNVTFQATKKVVISAGTSMYVTNNSEISGDVNAKIGTNTSYGFATSGKSYFYGVADSNVKGNVNYTIDGRWYTRTVNNLVRYTDVDKDVNIIWDGGYFGCYNSGSLSYGFVYGNLGSNANSIGNIYVTVTGEGADSYQGTPYVVAGCAVNNIVYNGETIATSASYISSNSETTLNGYLYANKKGAVTIGGTYTIEEDITTTTLTVLEDADVTIAEGVTVTAGNTVTVTGTLTNNGTLNTTTTVTLAGTLVNNGTLTTDRTNAGSSSSSYDMTLSGKLVNNGTWGDKNNVKLTGSVENNGSMYCSASYTLTISSGCFVTNNEGGNLALGKISNGGTIVNYGELSQNYGTKTVGKICTTTTPIMYYALSNYNTIYYALALDYPAYCFEDSDTAPVSFVTSTYLISSGIDGDSNQYVLGGATFSLKVSGNLNDNLAVESVVYGTEETEATTNDNVTWSGTALREPFTVTVNVADSDATPIELDKTEDTVENITVGVATNADNPLYDLTAITISNDTEVTNGYVTYAVKSGNTLPDGLVIKNGKIYGTPTTASDTEQKVTFVIRGMNQTTAEFVLTFSKIAKGTPTLTLPANIRTAVGTKLSEVTIPTNKKGTFEWVDGDTVVAATDTDGSVYAAWFTPADADNYDWSLLDEAIGTYQADEGKVKVLLTVKTYKSTPEYTVPEDVTAIYGDTLADVIIPEAENGKFEWMDTTLSVGSVGTGKFKARFVPNDTTTYEIVNNIVIKVTINPQPVEYTPESIELVAHEGTTLDKLELPEVENGKYQWITSSDTVISGEVTYKLGYKPDDTDNYDWSKVEGWSKSYKCVIIPVTVDVVAGEDHSFVKPYKYDDTYHWLECTCGDVSDKAEHTWNEGEVTKKASATETGVMTYTCTVCGATKAEDIPVDTSHKHSYNSTWKNDTTYHWHECECGDVADKAEHTWDDGKVTTAATTTKTGVKTYTCTVCSATKTETIPAIADNGNNSNGGNGNNGSGSNGNDNNSGSDANTSKIVKGKTYTVKKMKYKVTKVAANGKGTVTLVGTTNKKTAKSFTSLKIGKTVTINGVKFKITAIGNNAFKGYKKLKTVTIGANVKTIGKNAFSGCTKLSKLTIGKNVTTIGASAFNKCTSLKAVTIPAKVKSIGAKAFYGCKKLATVTIKTTKLTTKKVGSKAFKGIKSNATVKITKKKYAAYKKFLAKKGLGKKVKYKKA
jgi:sorbitol-specific phosphotransferase system component IIA